MLEIVESSDKLGDICFGSSTEGKGDVPDVTVSDVELVIVAELSMRQWNESLVVVSMFRRVKRVKGGILVGQ